MIKLLNEIKNAAIKNNIPIIEDETAEFLKDYIINNNVKSILEIGSATGYSASFMVSISDDIYVDTIEKNNDRFLEAVKNINKVNLFFNKQRIKIINEDALNIDLSLLKNEYDLIFVDGPKAQNIIIVNYFEKILKNHGSFIIDNIDFHGFVINPKKTKNRNTVQLVKKIKKFIEWINENDDYHTEYFKIGDGIIVARKEVTNE
ncbi:MAG: O-methyltransferase [Bacilli bacterium]|jgi:predicted O-methyltransferase YrrM|nr:O-methyltransferase [Bacilli bacterium]